jgi:hypothetical protein
MDKPRLRTHPRIQNLAADCPRLTMADLETRVRHEARILLADPMDIWDILPDMAEPPLDDPEVIRA